jgi:hypothetical protein
MDEMQVRSQLRKIVLNSSFNDGSGKTRYALDQEQLNELVQTAMKLGEIMALKNQRVSVTINPDDSFNEPSTITE